MEAFIRPNWTRARRRSRSATTSAFCIRSSTTGLKRGCVRHNPVALVEKPRTANQDIRFLTLDELEAILMRPRQHRWVESTDSSS